MTRKQNGQFAEGNGGGPGRPPRATENEYLRVFGDKLTLAEWGAIVDKSLAMAKLGDSKARDFIAKYALGEKPRTLLDVAKLEGAGFDTAREVQAAVQKSDASPLDASDWGLFVSDSTRLAKLLER